MDRCKWRKVIKEVRWPGWVWAGKCFFWYRPTRVVPDKWPLNGCCCCTKGARLFLSIIHLQNRKNVWDSVRKLAYDIPKRNHRHIISHYRELIVRQTSDNITINRKILSKWVPEAYKCLVKNNQEMTMKMLLVLSWRYSFLSKLVVFGVYFYKPKDRNFKLHKISSS